MKNATTTRWHRQVEIITNYEDYKKSIAKNDPNVTPINDETTKREPYDGYLVYQGGVPEVEEFVKKVRK